MIRSIIQALFIRIQHSMSEQENKRCRIYDLLNAQTKPKFCQAYTKQRIFFKPKKSFLKRKVGDWTTKQKAF